MKTVMHAIVAIAVLATQANAGVIKIDLDSSAAAKFSGIGTANATYTDTVQIMNSNTGMLDSFDLAVSLAGSGNITLGSTGLGIGDGKINAGETLKFTFALTPSLGTTSSLGSFQFTEIGHGLTVSDLFGTGSFAAVSDGVNGTVLGHNVVGPTDISNLNGKEITVRTSSSPDGSVDGISSLSFEATAVPEPSSVMLCGLCMLGMTFSRRRRAA
ncbi:MAG: PEP-CTERM sorting domain-containing protein [Planctomycetaceae bacterium]